MCDQAWGESFEEYKAEHIRRLEESIQFLGREGKAKREAWVVRQFLRYLGENASEDEIKASERENDSVDITFRNAVFQIKEIFEQERRRLSEYKAQLERAINATSRSDFLEDYTPRAITVEEAVAHVIEKVEHERHKRERERRDYAPAVKRKTDLLLYLNPVETSVVGDTLPSIANNDDLRAWRSVSVVGNACAFVLAANTDAPDFIRAGKGLLLRRT